MNEAARESGICKFLGNSFLIPFFSGFCCPAPVKVPTLKITVWSKRVDPLKGPGAVPETK